MKERLYSVDEVAEHLGLHARTVRNYVRDGRLTAVRIGKQYRITQEDLEAFTGRPVPPPVREGVRRERRSEVSAIVEVEAVPPETAHRLTTLVTASATGRGPQEEPLRVQAVYDPDRARMKVVLMGSLADTARMLEYIEGLVEA
ncbi:helix-turn-helix domain-containing protein [Nocardiopsis sp. CNT312]|uniref:helix-turn-helix domain-containing protein n=1 Tax=Nocardiopsis sp. CNT312 TaxID=1137268 RepID=UPI00048CE8D0|nr:helix-turn-helix domain-containing protein [Nocardiopsis sp. CNT312]